MIKLRKSEEGYALLLVLFLVVFIMSITAVFMRGAISNAKQEQIVDKNNLAVVAAEMGVEYYETALANEYYIKIKKLKAKEDADIALEMIKNDGKDIDYKEIRRSVTKELRTHLENHLKGYMDELKGVPIIKSYQFSLITSEFVPEDQDDQNGVIILTATVKGEKDGNIDGGKIFLKELNFKQAFLVPSFDPAVTGGGGNGGGNKQLPPPKPVLNLDDYYNELSEGIPCKGVKVISGEICETINVEKIEKKSAVYVGGVLNAKHEVNVNTNSMLYINGAFNGEHKLEVANSAVYVGGVLTATNHIEVKTNSNLYITGALNGTKLEVDKSTVYVEGVLTATNDVAVKTGSNLYVTGALNGMGLEVDNSTVYSGGAVTVTNHTLVNNNSVLYITGALNANKKLDISESTVYVGGALTATNNHSLIVKSNSNLCVAGALSATGGINIDPNSRVYVFGAVTPKSVSEADNLFSVASLEELKEVCGSNAKADTPPAPTIDVTY